MTDMNKQIFNTFLIKYAEIGIKGNNRYLFEDALVAHINAAMKTIPGRFLTRKTPGRIYLECSEDKNGASFDFDEVVESLSTSSASYTSARSSCTRPRARSSSASSP